MELQERLGSKAATCELLVSLAHCALCSYRAGSVARPFPPNRAHPELLRCVGDLREVRVEQLPQETRELLEFVVRPDWVALRKVRSIRGADTEFEVRYGARYANEEHPNALARAKARAYESARERFPEVTAYHGSALANVHNIVREGLKNDFGGRNGAIFGEGIYLSTDIRVCSNFMTFDRGWPHSRWFSRCAVVLECSVVVDPASVANGEDESSDFPHTYVLVKNDALVRVKRVLVYRDKRASARSTSKVTVVFCLFLLLLLAWIMGSRGAASKIHLKSL